MNEANRLMELINSAALSGSKLPHGVSNPVFRLDTDGRIKVAVFIFTYSHEELKSRVIRRPMHWMTVDVADNDLVREHACTEEDFCSAPPWTRCDLNAETDEKFSEEYTKQTLAVFDLLLRKYKLTGVFDRPLNDAYMFMMLRTVSVGFKDMYRELCNL